MRRARRHAMTSGKLFAACLYAAVSSVGASVAHAQEPVADLILTNGKIVTVDDRFTIAQAVAIKDLKPVLTMVGGKIVYDGKKF